MEIYKKNPKKQKSTPLNHRLFFARLFIILVLILNLQAAVFFFASPQRYVPSFQLSGETGPFVIQSMGVLFLMWTVPYFFAAINPIKYQVSLVQAVIMQIIAATGECVIFLNLPEKLTILKLSLQRFFLFDSAGVLLLITAFLLVRLQNDHE